MIATYVPGPDRNDWTGEVGVRYGIASDVTVSWIGIHVNTPGGTRNVKLIEWFADAVQRTVVFDLTGKMKGSWVWQPIAPLLLPAGSYYAILQEVTNGDGLWWDDATGAAAATGGAGVANLYGTYRVPGGSMTAYAANIMYVGLDLGW